MGVGTASYMLIEVAGDDMGLRLGTCTGANTIYVLLLFY